MNLEDYKNFKKYSGINILAIDYGTKITGLASFCPGKDPFPYPYGKIIYKDDMALIESIKEITTSEEIELIVVGLPLLLDGKKTDMTSRVKNFGSLLDKELKNIEVYFQDETLSTYEAKNRMKNSPYYNFKIDPQKIDALAATIILEDFIRS